MSLTRTNDKSQIAINLVNRIESGDRAAETEMVERYHQSLITVLYNRSEDKQLAQDAAQDTWVLVIRKVREGQLKDKSKLVPFIIQIGKYQLIMHYRSVRRHPSEGEQVLASIEDESATPIQSVQNQQLGEKIEEAFSKLKNERDYEMLRRFYHVGDDKQDLCHEYGLSSAHFDRVIFRARQRFKSIWESMQEYQT